MHFVQRLKESWPSAADRRAFAARCWRRMRRSGLFYVGSLGAHLLLAFALLPLSVDQPDVATAEPQVDTLIDPELQEFEVGAALLRGGELSASTIQLVRPPRQVAKSYDDSPVFEEAGGGTLTASAEPVFGGLGGFENELGGDGPDGHGNGGVGVGLGSSDKAGNGGHADGFNGHGHGRLDELDGQQVESERAVAAALSWLARHQNEDGSWGLGQFPRHCHDEACTDAGQIESPAAATALAVLPFLAANQTPTANGPYQRVVARGVELLVNQQGPDGNLAGRSDYLMYVHGLATLALCEAFHMSGDQRVGAAAQRAVRFIELAQNPTTGGWQYQPGDRGDTSVTGWQILALHSAVMAGLSVDSECQRKAGNWFASVSQGEHGGLATYVPGSPVTPNMTAVGLLSRRCLGLGRDHPLVVEGSEYLLARRDDQEILKNSYCCFFATQLFDGRIDQKAEAWNDNVRRHLLGTQAKSGCLAGSWYPEDPSELWTPKGGRLMTTSLAALTLEISHHYLPIFKTGSPQLAHRPKPAPRRSADSKAR